MVIDEGAAEELLVCLRADLHQMSLPSRFGRCSARQKSLAIGAVPIALLVGLQPELGQRIHVSALPVLWTLGQVSSHARLGRRRERYVEAPVDRSHGADRVRGEIA